MQLNDRIFVTGHNGLVGSALKRVLESQGYTDLLTATRNEVDLRDWRAVRGFFSEQKPKYVILCAAKVGGIVANSTQPVEFLLDNLRIQNNVIEASKIFGVEKLLFLGSACAYPKFATCPIREESLLTGMLESSNEGYALAKISGIRLCQAYRKQYGCNFIAAMPTNLYGPGDSYDLENSHVLPGMLRRMHEAKDAVRLWGTGSPIREFLYSDDLARACITLMQKYDKPELINIGTGNGITLSLLAQCVAHTVGFHGSIFWDTTKPDGTPTRYLDCSKIHALGWRHRVELLEGLKIAYQDFLCRQH